MTSTILISKPISVRVLLNYLFKNFLISLFAIFILWALALTYIYFLPNYYSSNLVVTAVKSDSESLSSQAGGLAALAGFNMDSSSEKEKKVAFSIIKSKKFISSFIDKNMLAEVLFAGIAYDDSTNKIIYDTEKLKYYSDNSHSLAVKKLLIDKFVEALYIEEDSRTSTISISFFTVSPILARDVPQKIVDEINDIMRTDALEETERSIIFLESELETNPNVSVKLSLGTILEKQLEKKILNEVRTDYFFKTIDPTVLPYEPTKPRKLRYSLLAFIAIFILVQTLFTLRYIIREA